MILVLMLLMFITLYIITNINVNIPPTECVNVIRRGLMC